KRQEVQELPRKELVKTGLKRFVYDRSLHHIDADFFFLQKSNFIGIKIRARSFVTKNIICQLVVLQNDKCNQPFLFCKT
ncbi:MAG: hypothetical protein II908_08290, partial [Bacteroidaceae bacterium]|nr:hypothetical protein [Bacteroidaceae bacterium]